MGIIGGDLVFRFLNRISPAGDPSVGLFDGSAYAHRSKLAVLFGEQLLRHVEGADIVDFGCGTGQQSIELIAQFGARSVVGLDLIEHYLEQGRAAAVANGVSDRVHFTSAYDGKADVIISLDSFEHFADPGAVLASMAAMLSANGRVLVSFGPPWYHPLGGHMFSPFPWAHLVVTEKTLMRWRNQFRSDGATRFEEIEGGLNRMSIGRFLRLVDRSPLQIDELEIVPIRRLRHIHNTITREFTTSVVRGSLKKR